MSLGGIVVSYKLENIGIDKNETAEKVRCFLDDEFQTYLNRAGLHRTDLSSPKMDITGITAHGGNSQEAKVMKIFDYEAKCMAIYKTIDNCQENKNLHVYHRSILYDRFILQLEDWQVAQRINLSASRYRDIKQDALCEFAERLPVWAYRLGTRLKDLVVYSNEEVN